MNKEETIKEIKRIIKEHGEFSTKDVEADSSPLYFAIGITILTIESFGLLSVKVHTTIDGDVKDYSNADYEMLSDDNLYEILQLAEDWEAICLEK